VGRDEWKNVTRFGAVLHERSTADQVWGIQLQYFSKTDFQLTGLGKSR
jgi:hypothetical protein